MSLHYQKLLNCISESFWTKQEFDVMLQQYAESVGLKRVAFQVSGPNWEETVYGKMLPDVEPQVMSTLSSEGDVPKIICHIWSEQAVEPQTQEDLSKIIHNYLYLPPTSECLLPFYGVAEIKERCNVTLHRFISQGHTVAVFMVDLDHFKEVNDKYDHDTGSRVLAQFSDLLRQQCLGENAIVIHRSGDEFFLLMPYNDASAPLRLAYRIREAARTYTYEGVQGISLTAAQGICLCQDSTVSFEEAVTMAENAYNPKGKHQTKKRDSVRLVCPGSHPPSRGEEDRDRAFVIVKTHLDCDCLFRNPYLDFLSSIAANQMDETNVQSELDCAIDWITPGEATGMQLLSKSSEIGYQCEWSIDELAFTLFHGLCRNNMIRRQMPLQLNFFKESQGFSITSDKVVLYQCPEDLTSSKSKSYSLILPEKMAEQYETRTSILVQIGYQELSTLEDCFYRVIRIDSRATIGGNLPDFWAAALSELIELLWKNPFLQHVLVYGKREHGQTFSDVLEHCSQWGTSPYSYSFLAKKTQQPIEHIQHCQKCLAHAIRFIEAGENEHLISAMVEVCQKDYWFQQQLSPLSDVHRHFLERKLDYERIRPSIEDGCIVDTLEEAFPTVLEIIRNCFDDHHLDCIKDQAGRVFQELTNFKVVIRKPNSKYVPEYYEEEKERLEYYYQSVFGDRDGFFQKHFQENGQYDAVLSHILHLISDDGLQYATRRAVLVLPHIVKDPDDITPLGLVSVYIAPRKLGEEIKFDFSFTWRTVEAVVGFPYSLYGSVRYAEQLLETIRQTCIPSWKEHLRMGSVSYLAYSLHMFLDNSYTQIIRGIINDASK